MKIPPDSSPKSRLGQQLSWTLATLALAGQWSFSAIAKDACTPISMPAGQNTIELSGTASGHGRDDDPGIQCYSLAVNHGQSVHIRLIGGENVAITIPDVGDARDAFDFEAKQDRYEVRVFQLFPGGGDEVFRIQIETGAAPARR